MWDWVQKLCMADHVVASEYYSMGRESVTLTSRRAALMPPQKAKTAYVRCIAREPEASNASRDAGSPLDLCIEAPLEMETKWQLPVFLQCARAVAQRMPAGLTAGYEMHVHIRPTTNQDGHDEPLSALLAQRCTEKPLLETLARAVLCGAAARIGNYDLACSLLPARGELGTRGDRQLARNLTSLYAAQRGESAEAIPDGLPAPERARMQAEVERDLMLTQADLVEACHLHYHAWQRSDSDSDLGALLAVACQLNLLRLEAAITPTMEMFLEYGCVGDRSRDTQAVMAMEQAAETFVRAMVRPSRPRPVSQTTRALIDASPLTFAEARRVKSESGNAERWLRAAVADLAGSTALTQLGAAPGPNRAMTALRSACKSLGVTTLDHQLNLLAQFAFLEETRRPIDEAYDDQLRRKMRSVALTPCARV